jgi:hypothetical protein
MKYLCDHYKFDPQDGHLHFYLHDFDVELASVLIVTNVTRNEIIYLPQIDGKGGVIDDDMLSFDYDVSAHDERDELQIFLEISDVDVLGDKKIQTIYESLSRDRTLLRLMKEQLVVLTKIEKHLESMDGEEIDSGDLDLKL